MRIDDGPNICSSDCERLKVCESQPQREKSPTSKTASVQRIQRNVGTRGGSCQTQSERRTNVRLLILILLLLLLLLLLLFLILIFILNLTLISRVSRPQKE